MFKTFLMTTALVLPIAFGDGAATAQTPAKKPNVVMLMTDDTGWNDFGAYSGGGAALGHPAFSRWGFQ